MQSYFSTTYFISSDCFHKEKQENILMLTQSNTTSGDGIIPLINAAANHIACNDRSGSILCQTLASWFSSPWSSVCETELLNWQMSSTILIFFRFSIPTAPLHSAIPHPGPYLFHCVAVQNRIITFLVILLICRDINHIPREKHLLRINIARINTGEVIKSVSSQLHELLNQPSAGFCHKVN